MHQAAQVKACSACKRSKPLDEFPRDRRAKDGRYAYCLKCSARKRRRWKKSNWEHCHEIAVAYRQTWNGRLRNMLSGARRRAAKKELEFSLDDAWLRQTVKRLSKDPTCPVTGVLMELDKAKTTNKSAPHPASPTLDRIDPSKGYTKSNVQVVCYWANSAKGMLRQEMFEQMVLWTAEEIRKKQGNEQLRTGTIH